ncbi:ArsR/SmtB family transcription factor [Roseateles oligotrophus]|uniref:ArsR family transcriptional regulator n=1 Tax=Roseateles oligotrophus TaxID=1769250 RepID=A0ABT2YHG7_9BURK|nr:helix-turn-helix transcriptional regulator [Roseateles oligotrophus]MCV2369498.1 ArsR family transcriptional regulator [Roseateles oligotrophus]
MDDKQNFADMALAELAQSMAEPARARMLCCLMDGHARTATELAAVGEVAASTASAHLARLNSAGLIECQSQGRHRYYKLAGGEVGAALEAMLVLAGRSAGSAPKAFEPSTPPAMREARRCYDHLAGEWAVRLHDHVLGKAWLEVDTELPRAYTLSGAGEAGFAALGLDVTAARSTRRRLACACMDWSVRSPHLGGALGAAWLQLMLAEAWVESELDSRALRLTQRGRSGLQRLLGLSSHEF